MAVRPAPQQPDELRSALLVARQPVVDVKDRVTGYRISYALFDDDDAVAATTAESKELVDDILSVISSDELALGGIAHLPVSREMLLSADGPRARPEEVMLRVSYDDAIGLDGPLKRATERGYKLLLDELPGPAIDASLLRHFTAVELDFNDWSSVDLDAVMPQLRLRRATPLAAGICTHEEREHARALGFEWFSGPFLNTPNLLDGAPIPVGNLRTLAQLARLQGPDASLDELVDVIESDLGLGVRLLRYINSAYFGLAGRVRSIRHAATMLGARGLSRWALVAASVGGAQEIPRELGLTALTRARSCELVSVELDDPVDSDEMFTIGLLSAADAVFRMPMEKVIEELPLADSTARALLHHSGPAGKILRSVITYEQGEFLAPTVRATLLANADAYRSGLMWARQAITGLS